jgi:glycine/D-amino acid oxidase-like deaminating enzyme
VIENCPVTDILTRKNDFGTRQVTGVVTTYGAIKTDCVVNCAGKYNRDAEPAIYLTALQLFYVIFMITSNI